MKSPDAGTPPRGDGATRRAATIAGAHSDDMLGDLAHAVANSLNTIVTASQLAGLLMTDGRVEQARNSLDCVERECLRVARLLQDGRAFASYGIGELQAALDVGELLEQCADTFAARGGVHIDAAPGVGRVRGNPEALRRLFVELFDNAFEFGAHRVDVTVTREESGGAVRVDFEDDGPGISAAPTRVFDPFFSTHPEEHSGLGLALAARIAAGHGGSVTVEPAARGAAFRVELPSEAG